MSTHLFNTTVRYHIKKTLPIKFKEGLSRKPKFFATLDNCENEKSFKMTSDSMRPNPKSTRFRQVAIEMRAKQGKITGKRLILFFSVLNRGIHI